MGLKWASIQLDVVGLLAVIGESAMSAHAAIATASKWGLVPRLIPAPLALFRYSRPNRLPPVTQGVTAVVGVFSGNAQKELSYFANLLHGIDLPQYTVSALTISHKQRNHEPSDAENGSIDIDAKPVGTVIQNAAPAGGDARTSIPLRRLGPVNLLSFLGALAALGILILAIIEEDGMAVVAILLLSVTSSIVGLGSKWSLVLPERPDDGKPIPKANIMVCGRQGAFLYITCTEKVARELYFGQEECEYLLPTGWFQVIAGISTFLLMAAVIAMANCTLVLQYVLGITYILMNGLYWLAALLPEDWHWNLDAVYDVEFHDLHEPTMGGSDKNHLEAGRLEKDNDNEKFVRYKRFTHALIAAIELAGGADWVRVGEVSPRNAAWNAWLEEADQIWVARHGERQDELRRKWKEWNPSLQLGKKLGNLAVSRSNTDMKIAESHTSTHAISTPTTTTPRRVGSSASITAA